MPKPIATYEIRVTVREPDPVTAGEAPPIEPPTNEEVEAWIKARFADRGLDARARSTRTDK